MTRQAPGAVPHLDDANFAGYVSGSPLPPEVNAHLAACRLCQQEVQAFLSTADDLSLMSLAWSQSRLPSRPLSTFVTKTSSSPRWRPAFPQLSMATAALVLALGSTFLWHTRHAPPTEFQTASVASDGVLGVDDTSTQIAQDNQLLQSVDFALSDTDPSPYREFGLEGGVQTGTPKLSASHAGVRSE